MARYQISRRFGVEASAGFFHPEDPGTCQCVLEIQTIPVDVNVHAFLFPDSPFSLYALAGVALETTSVDAKDQVSDPEPYESRNYSRFGLQAGLGVEISFGSRFAVTTDSRAILYAGAPIPDPAGKALAQRNTVQATVGLHYFF
jgi:opacity protein-like surface antigen